MAKNDVVINKKTELSRLRKEERALKATLTGIEKSAKSVGEAL